MSETPKKLSTLQLVTKHKAKVIEMWNQCCTMRDIHNFLTDQGGEISYDQLRKTCRRHLNFDTSNLGQYLDTTQSDENSGELNTPDQAPKKAFEYNPTAPSADSFWNNKS